MENQKLTVTVNEMAKMLGISRPTAYELTKREGFPAIRVSERRIIILRWTGLRSGSMKKQLSVKTWRLRSMGA